MQAAPRPHEAANDGSSAPIDPSNPAPAEREQVPWVSVLLQQASDQAQASLEAALTGLGIDPRQYRIAWLVREFGPQSQVALCDMLTVDRASMVKFVDRLEARGWVTREPHPSDRRQNAVTLTAKGKKGLKAADAAAQACEERSLAALSPQQRAALAEILKVLVQRGPMPE